VDQAVEAVWSPDSKKLAVVRIVTSSSARTVTGFEEDPKLSLLDLERGTVQDLGDGSRPRWSESGSFLSFWRGGRLHVTRAGAPVAVLDATVPDTRWVGDELLTFFRNEIWRWSEAAGDQVVATMAWDQMPRFPVDDAFFSADGVLFTVTRYGRDGGVQRFIGETATGGLQPLDAPGATFTEWAPVGRGLLVRFQDAIEMIGASRTTAPISSFPGPVHGWTADGSLLMGAVSVGSATAFDQLKVWREGKAVGIATLPNLVASRSFSPDGRHFAGIARAGLHETALEVYQCGTRTPSQSQRAAPVARAAASLAGDGLRLMRPVAGYISQFFQGFHTGLDIAAPVGATLHASDDGEVTHVGWIPVGGRAVCVTHPLGLESCYYHTSTSYVTVGQHVVRGQPVAAIGMTGLTTGPHVHWEVKKDGRLVDPLGVRR
jgi:murein DD-endopeptidase MepM/ murein hydrolase activator NlpD